MTVWNIVAEIKALANLSKDSIEMRFGEMEKAIGLDATQSLWTALNAIGDRAKYVQQLIEADEDDRLPPPTESED